MNHTAFNKKGTIKFLFWSFLIAWVLQIIAAVLSWNGLAMAGRLMIAVCMFAPMLGVPLSGQKLAGMGWKPRLKGNIKVLLLAWFLPSVLIALGAALYFAVFPGHFDLSGAYMVQAAGEDALAQMEAQGISYPVYILILVVGCLTSVPLVNMLVAVGEEAGWRGFLYPQLKAKFGRKKGLLLGGVIWSMWHWPLMWLIGYEYGKDYPGFPFVGMLVFTVFTTAAGILCDWVYEKSGCIWFPSIAHGVINASGTIPLAICVPVTGAGMLVGPAPIGILAGLPLLACAVVLFLKAVKQEDGQ